MNIGSYIESLSVHKLITENEKDFFYKFITFSQNNQHVKEITHKYGFGR